MRHILIDTDTGSDDVWAIIAALRATEDVHVDAITVVCGNVPLESCVKNALIATEVADTYFPPVYSGMSRPIVKEKLFSADYVHGSDGLGEMNLPYPAHQPEKQHAVDALVEHIMASDGELELITLGPLTNVAMAYLKEPAIAKKLKKLWIMGGTGYDQGNATPAAEFNVYVDPEAAHIVMHAGFNAVWVTWDVARFGTEITPEDLEMLRAKDHPVSNFCIRCTQSLREYDRKKFGHAGFGVIDSVIMMACLYPDLMVAPYSAYCDIEISHTLAYGYFSIDKHHQLHHADNCTVCSKVEAEGYKRHLFHLLSD